MDAVPASILRRFTRFIVGSPSPEPGLPSFSSPSPEAQSAATRDEMVRATRERGSPTSTIGPPTPRPMLAAPGAARSRDPSPVAYNAATPHEIIDACIDESVRLRDAGECERALDHLADVRAHYALSAAQDASLLMHLGRLEQQLGHFAVAIAHYEAALHGDTLASDEHKSSALFQVAMAKHLWRTHGADDAPSAEELSAAFAQASDALVVEVSRNRLSRPRRATVVHNQGFLAEQLGDDVAALGHYTDALSLRAQLGDTRGQGYSYHRLAIVADRLGNREMAAQASAQAVCSYRAAGISGQPRVREAEQLERDMATKLASGRAPGSHELA